MDITTIGFDLAKTVFQVHGADGALSGFSLVIFLGGPS
jgi:hypothetical protein